MKKGDWVLVAFTAIIVGIVSFSSMNSLFADTMKPTENVPTSVIITDNLEEPSKIVYSADDRNEPPINPAIITRTGGGEVPASDKPDDDTNDATNEEDNTKETEENIDEEF